MAAAGAADTVSPVRAHAAHFALPPEQLQYRMRAALQDEKLLSHQLQMEAWECREDRCQTTVRVPVSSEAGRRHDMGSVEDLMQRMRVEAKAANAELSLRSAIPGRQGISIELDLTPISGGGGRYYTDDEIARIRMETVQQLSRPASQAQGQP